MIQNMTMNQNSKMDLNFILADSAVLNKCKECNKEFERTYDYYRHLRSVHGGSARCLLCGLNQRSAVRKDMKVRHLTRCEGFKRDCITMGITNTYLIKKRAREMMDILFEYVPQEEQPYTPQRSSPE